MHPQSEGTIAQEALEVLFLIGDASLFINMPTHECTALLQADFDVLGGYMSPDTGAYHKNV